MRYKYLLLILLAITPFVGILAQSSIGGWTDYQSFTDAKCVADAGDKVYCVTDGGLFSYNKTDNSVQKITGISGLSDTGIERVAYDKTNKTLLIAYQNANIDLLVGNKVFNLSDIKRKQIPADKTINNILFSGNLAYLSCGFGIVVLNLERREIKDTYFIGTDGDYLRVMDLATDGNFLYAATENGIYKASATESNLQNYNNWIRETTIPHFDKRFNAIEFFNGHIIANYNTNEWASDELYLLDGDIWMPFLSTSIRYVKDITNNGKSIVFTSREEVFVYNEKYDQIKYVRKYPLPGYDQTIIYSSSAIFDDQNILWVAYRNQGLVKVDNQVERIVPEGPVNNRIFSLMMSGQDLWITAGGRTNDWNNLRFEPVVQLNREGSWSSFTRNTFPELNNFNDMVCVAVDPNNPDHFFAGSWGGGVIEFDGGKLVKRYNNSNSTLQTELPEDPSAPYVRIGGMSYDSKGVLWVANSGVGKVISALHPDGKWDAYGIPNIANKSIGKLVVTQKDDKWIVIPRGNGLYVLNSENNATKQQKVVALFENKDGPYYTDMNDVYSMTEDLKGQIWVGTSMGVAVFSSPENIWLDGTMYASRPGLNLHDTFFHPLLEKETVTAIAVDGANRKWFGTKASGVFLVSEDGETEIEHFNTDNSPLPNNEISDIAINQKTGEVFIGTQSGLISYMGEATSGNDEFADVYVYPNPVRETYEGSIVIKGLVDDTDVRITDISGNLVNKTNSLGGQAIWDGKNLNGKRCKTGVYLIFMTDPTGEKTKTTKLLFIH